jgi:hypothetical protein
MPEPCAVLRNEGSVFVSGDGLTGVEDPLGGVPTVFAKTFPRVVVPQVRIVL